MEKLLVKGLAIIAAGGCATKAILTVRKYKQQKELHEAVTEEARDEK